MNEIDHFIWQWQPEMGQVAPTFSGTGSRNSPEGVEEVVHDEPAKNQKNQKKNNNNRKHRKWHRKWHRKGASVPKYSKF